MNNKKLVFFAVLFFYVFSVFAQRFTISGKIVNSQNEALPFATVLDKNNGTGTSANEDGIYILKLPQGEAKLMYSFTGMQKKEITFRLTKDTVINIVLNNIQLSEVEVSESKIPFFERKNIGEYSINTQTIQKLPSFLGQPDLMKSITLLPGFSSGRDGLANLYVRGGDRGQNLVLLDGVKLYTTNHLGGFVSLIDPLCVKKIDAYKGGFPARFGGRVSSVIDIHSKNGNTQKLHGTLNPGVLFSSFFINGPIKKKSSFITSFRISNLYALNLKKKWQVKHLGGLGSYSNINFYDFFAKYHHSFNPRKTFSLMVYNAADIFESYEHSLNNEQEYFNQGKSTTQNYLLSASYRSVLKNDAYWKINLNYTHYAISDLQKNKYLSYGQNEANETQSQMYINEWSSTLFYAQNFYKHRLKAGIELSNYYFLPQNYSFLEKDITSGQQRAYEYKFPHLLNTLENDIFAEDSWYFYKKLSINAGIRYKILYSDKQCLRKVEPRIILNLPINTTYSFKANYTEMNQEIHQLIQNQGEYESEIWLPAKKNLPFEESQQWAAGFFAQYRSLEVSLEAYYKKLNHLLYYLSPLESEPNFTNIDSFITKNGTGESYGIELFSRLSLPKINMNFSLSFSKTTRHFESLNKGQSFYFRYDRPFAANILLFYKFAPRYELSANFIIQSGTPFTLPVSYTPTNRFFYGQLNYTSINNVRLPLYHRLDVSLKKMFHSTKRGKQFLLLNIYNIYARQNPNYIYYNTQDGKLHSLTYFTIIPSISYVYEF